MGLGKTVQCIEALNHLARTRPRSRHSTNRPLSPIRVLIVCPKSVLGVWQNELKEWMQVSYQLNRIQAAKSTPSTTEDGLQPEEETEKAVSITMINYDLCPKHEQELQQIAYNVLICDEAHRLKTPHTQRTLAVFGDGSHEHPGVVSEYLWLISGTPMPNRPFELYAPLGAIHRRAGVWNYTRAQFYREFCNPEHVVKDGTTMQQFPELRKLLEGFMLRREKKDVLKQMPAKVRSCVVLTPPDGSNVAQRERQEIQELLQKLQKLKQQQQHEKEPSSTQKRSVVRSKVNQTAAGGSKALETANQKKDLEAFGAMAMELRDYIAQEFAEYSGFAINQHVLGLLVRIRHNTAMQKLEPALELLEDILKSGNKVVVFCHHLDLMDGLLKHFGRVRSVCLRGGLSDEERKEAVDRFQNDPRVSVFVGSMLAAGVGLTLTAASRVVFLELDWTPATMSQAEDRCHRVGQVNCVQVQYFVFADTLDEFIAQTLVNKQKVIDELIQPREGGQDNKTEESNEVYCFDFGKYNGRRLDQVPTNYIEFLVQRQVWKERPRLWHALARAGQNVAAPPPLSSFRRHVCQSESAGSSSSSSTTVNFVLDFGKYSGQEWNVVPRSYRNWILRDKVWEKRPNLSRALRNAGYHLET